MRKATICALLLIACTTGFAQVKVRQINILMDATFPPMEYESQSGELIGFEIDLLKEICAFLQANYTIIQCPWYDIFTTFQNSDYQAILSSVTITSERLLKFDFTIPYINAGQVIVIAKGIDFQSLAKNRTIKIGVQENSTGAYIADQYTDIDSKEYEDINNAFVDLTNGKIDGVMCDQTVCSYYVNFNNDFKDSLYIATDLLNDEFFGFVVHKGDTETLNRLNDAIKSLQESGRLKDLLEKWGMK